MKPSATRDDHRADRVRSHDVGIVVDLDAAWRACECRTPRRARRAASPAMPPRTVCGPASRRQFCAACSTSSRFFRRAEARAISMRGRSVRAKRSAEHGAILDLVRKQNEARRRLVRVELREEGVEHLGAAQGSCRRAENRRDCPSSDRCGRRRLRRRTDRLLRRSRRRRLLRRFCGLTPCAP